uniref:S-phase kinase-associated protein 1 n=1 Tax=Acanthochromis polyacanthus TaxID=80966 RepID=A0A3Q1FKN2_9TELE
MPTIKLQSSDGEIFEVDVEIAKQSVTIKTMLEDLGMDDEGDDDPVPLPNVNAAILKKVIQWCTHHKDDPPPPEDDENKEKRTDDIPVWDQEFLKVDQGTLFELILVNTLYRSFRLLTILSSLDVDVNQKCIYIPDLISHLNFRLRQTLLIHRGKSCCYSSWIFILLVEGC